jgi:hypothetical protein
MPCNFFVRKCYTYLSKNKRDNFLKILHIYTVIAPRNNLQSAHFSQHWSSFISTSRQNCCNLMTEPQPNRCLQFIIRRTVMSSKMFLHFGKQTKFRRRHVEATYLVIQDGDAKVSNLRSCSGPCVLSTAFILNDSVLHVKTKSLKSWFQLCQCFTISLKVNSCAREQTFWMHHAYNIPENCEHFL